MTHGVEVACDGRGVTLGGSWTRPGHVAASPSDAFAHVALPCTASELGALVRRVALEAESATALGLGESLKAFALAAGYKSLGQHLRKSAMCLVVLDDQRVQVIPSKTNGEHMGQDQHVDSIDPDDRALGLMVVEALRRAATPVNLEGITDL